jgi:hypothetical protein
MTARKPDEDAAVVVLVGSFNPAIFQPAWFASKELIRESEAAGVENLVVGNEVAQFRADWLSITVTRQRFQVMASDPAHHPLLRDLVLGTFHLLEHTPITRLGINRAMHFRFPDATSWHAFGDFVMPKPPWNGILEKPGLRSLFVESTRKDGLLGRIFVRVEPSQKLPESAYIEVTDDVLPSTDEASDPTTYFMSIIQRDWERLQRGALDLATTLLERCHAQSK